MTSKLKVAALIAAAAMVLVTPVFAQESNTSKSTAGVFKSDVDNSQNVHNYGNVDFGKWFGFIGYGTGYDTYDGSGKVDGTANHPVQLGYATRFSGIYLGAWYSGDIVKIRDNPVEQVTSNYSKDDQILTDTITETYNGGKTIESFNEVSALIGVAGMGFKVGFLERAKQTSYPAYTDEKTWVRKPVYTDGTTIYGPDKVQKTDPNTPNNDPVWLWSQEEGGTSISVQDNLGGVLMYSGEIVEYIENGNWLQPSLEWGMALNLGTITLKPKAKLGIGIGQYNKTDTFREKFIEVNGERIGDGKTKGDDIVTYDGYAANQIAPFADVGARVELSGVKIDAYYGLSLPLYSSAYDVAGFSDTVKGKVSWQKANSSSTTTVSEETTVTANKAKLDIEEITEFQHSIRIGVGTDKEVAEGLRLGVYGGANVGINTSATTSYAVTYNTTRTEYNKDALWTGNNSTESEKRDFVDTEKVTELSVKPYVNIGATYNWFPNRFAVHAGVRVAPCVFTNTTTSTSKIKGDVETEKTFNHLGEVTAEKVTVTDGDVIIDKTVVATTVDYLSAGVAGGFTFYFNSAASLDLGASIGGTNQKFNLDAANLSVLFTFKF